MSELYSVVLRGTQAGKDTHSVAVALAKAFGLEPTELELLLQRAPVVVKPNIDLASALSFRAAIQGAGAECELEPAPPTAAPDPPTAPVASDKPAAVCPKSGYVAKMSDDPLIVAYNGMGDCPSCGIIVAKFLASMQGSPAADARLGGASTDGPTAVPASLASARSWFVDHWQLVATVSVVALAIVVLASRGGGGDVKEKANAPSGEPPAQTAASGPADEARGSAYRIPPGERATFTIKGYFPLFHPNDVAPEVTVTPYKVKRNEWDKQRVEIRLDRPSLEASSVDLWEIDTGSGSFHLPSVAAASIFVNRPHRVQYTQEGRPGITLVKGKGGPLGKHLLVSKTLRKYIMLGKLPRDALAKQVKGLRFSEARATSYRVYTVRLELTITLPASDEFRRREGFISRTRSILVGTDGAMVQLSDMNGAVTVEHFARLELVQKKEPGLELLPPRGWQLTK